MKVAYTTKDAELSPCGFYRFWLERWHPRKHGAQYMFLLNNPSTADAEVDDATVRRGWGFTEMWGGTGMVFCNTNPWRSTDPREARLPPEDVLAQNDAHLRKSAQMARMVIAAWGALANPVLAARALRVVREVAPVYALSFTKTGEPGHILYLKGALTPQLWLPKL